MPNKPDKPILVNADKKRIIEVLTNLVINGIKYGKKKGFVKVGFYDFDDKIMVKFQITALELTKKIYPVFLNVFTG